MSLIIELQISRQTIGTIVIMQLLQHGHKSVKIGTLREALSVPNITSFLQKLSAHLLFCFVYSVEEYFKYT